MKFDALIEIVNKHYPDNMIAEARESQAATGEECGDTLALFIVRELEDTFDEDADDKTQLAEAVRCLGTAQEELLGVICGLEAIR